MFVWTLRWLGFERRAWAVSSMQTVGRISLLFKYTNRMGEATL